MRVRVSRLKTSSMNNRLIWIGILVVLAVTIATIANCRKMPDPWVPQVEGSERPSATTAEEWTVKSAASSSASRAGC